MSSEQDFRNAIQSVTDEIGSRTLDAALQADLNARFPAHGEVYEKILLCCKDGIANGWMCKHEQGGIRYGRVIKPEQELGGYSVDVVQMQDIAGPHHRHPNGEIDLIMPLSPAAKFDQHPAGWLVYGPGSAHSPTVSDGQALILYLLPQGAIEFSR
jgi:hypothetical protein